MAYNFSHSLLISHVLRSLCNRCLSRFHTLCIHWTDNNIKETFPDRGGGSSSCSLVKEAKLHLTQYMSGVHSHIPCGRAWVDVVSPLMCPFCRLQLWPPVIKIILSGIYYSVIHTRLVCLWACLSLHWSHLAKTVHPDRAPQDISALTHRNKISALSTNMQHQISWKQCLCQGLHREVC